MSIELFRRKAEEAKKEAKALVDGLGGVDNGLAVILKAMAVEEATCDKSRLFFSSTSDRYSPELCVRGEPVDRGGIGDPFEFLRDPNRSPRQSFGRNRWRRPVPPDYVKVEGYGK